jgi:DNA adenine methylase
VQSIFRYPGGKTKSSIQKWILSHRPSVVKEYREPFVGGGGIYFGLNGVESRWINDLHEGLIAVYQALADRPEEFIAKCREIAVASDDEEQTEPGPRGNARYSKRLKDAFHAVCLDKAADQAFRYFFVNRTVFGGRVNYNIPSRLYFSNPNGWNITKGDTLEQAAKHVAGTRITCGDYERVLSEPGEDVWIYCDPPYVVNGDLTPTSQLYQHGFNREAHVRFATQVRLCDHNVCVSYDDDPDGFIRDLFQAKEFRIIEAKWRYCGTTNDEKEVGKELLILNYDPPTSMIAAPEIGLLSDTLASDEVDELQEYESVIHAGFRQYVLVGQALQAIRDSGKPSRRLYRATHATFEDYCRDRWGFSRMQASRLVDAAAVAVTIEMSPIGLQIPTSERQARELARLETTEQAASVWQDVVTETQQDGTKITAAKIRDKVDEVLGVPEKESDPDAAVKSAAKLIGKMTFDQQRKLFSEHWDLIELCRERMEPVEI